MAVRCCVKSGDEILAPGPSAKKDIHSETANFCCRKSQITLAVT